MTLRREATIVSDASEARRLGRYVLVGEIAEGGFGRVYLARQLGSAGFERIVAVKVMLPERADERQGMAEMFFDEARIASRVVHPNVCTVHDYGEAHGVHYIVMEYLAGQPIMDIIAALENRPDIRHDPLFYPMAARVMAEACEGLHGAHTALDEHGEHLEVVHRDVSPENVFITYDGAVKVMDFGIARATGRIHETAAGTFKGKLPYASPQALMLEHLDPRTDVWSVGVVLWELLTGRGCFIKPTQMEVFGAVLKDPLRRPSSLHPDIPGALDSIVMLALSREPAGRYPTARHMARDLNKFAVSAGVHIGSGEIAEWMRELFPGGQEQAARTEGAVRRFDAALDAVPELDEEAVARPLVSRVVTRADGRVVSGFEGVDPMAQTVAATSDRISGMPVPSVPSATDPDFDFADAPTTVDPKKPVHVVDPPAHTSYSTPAPVGQRAIVTDTLKDHPAVDAARRRESAAPPADEPKTGGALWLVLKILFAVVVLGGAAVLAELLSR